MYQLSEGSFDRRLFEMQLRTYHEIIRDEKPRRLKVFLSDGENKEEKRARTERRDKISAAPTPGVSSAKTVHQPCHLAIPQSAIDFQRLN